MLRSERLLRVAPGGGAGVEEKVVAVGESDDVGVGEPRGLDGRRDRDPLHHRGARWQVRRGQEVPGQPAVGGAAVARCAELDLGLVVEMAATGGVEAGGVHEGDLAVLVEAVQTGRRRVKPELVPCHAAQGESAVGAARRNLQHRARGLVEGAIGPAGRHDERQPVHAAAQEEDDQGVVVRDRERIGEDEIGETGGGEIGDRRRTAHHETAA